MKRITALLLSIILTFCLSACGQNSESITFSQWSSQAPAIEVLKAYVEDVTNEASAGFIPVEARVAVFDMDGTLMCELFPAYFEWLMFTERALNDPSYTAPDAVRQEARRVLAAIEAGNKFPEDMGKTEAIMGAQAFAGMTMEQYADYVRSFMQTPAKGFVNLKRGDAFYLPMLEIITYLQQNEFLVYVVTGTDRFATRTILEGVIDIPPRQVIGMDVSLVPIKISSGFCAVYFTRSNSVMSRSKRAVSATI